MIPATISDSFLLALETHMRRTGQGRHLAASVLVLASTPDRATVAAAASALGHRHPLLHARIRRHFPSFLAHWLPDPPAPVPVTWHDAVADVHTLTARLIAASAIDIFRPGPNLEIHLAPAASGNACHLILLWPHALFDAVGIDLLIDELAIAPGDPAPARTQPSTGESATPLSASAAWPAAESILEEMRGFPAHPVRSLRQSRGPAGRADFKVIPFDAAATQHIRTRMAATAGELLLLPYFATLAARAAHAVIRLRHPSPDPAILLSIPVQRFPDPSRRPLFHNHMTPWSLLLEGSDLIDPASGSKALYRKYASFMRRKLPAAMDALMALMHRCPSSLYLKPSTHYLKGELCSLFHSHTGSFPARAKNLLGCDITAAWHVPTVSSPPGIGIFFSEFAGQLHATISWRENTLDATELELLESTLRTDLDPGPPAP